MRRIFSKRILPVMMAAAMLSTCVYVPVSAEETEDILAAAGFSELEDTVFTSEQMESKINLAAHVEDVYECVAGSDYVANEVVVEADDIDTAREYAEAYNAELLSFEYGKALLELNPDEAEIDDQGTDMVSLAVSLSSDTRVNLPAAWPNYYDEFFDLSYDYSEFDDFGYEYDDPLLVRSSGDHQWYHEIIDSNAAWRAGFKGRGVTVVVIDSGINEHEDITWDGAERLVTKSDGTYEITDEVQAKKIHGTPVSGIIRAKAGNGCGGAGIAPECSLYMIRVDNDSGSLDTYTESVAVDRAVEYYGADVINLSIGGPKYTEYYDKSVEAAYEHGTAVVCASGNDGTGSVSFPAAYAGAIAVSACDRTCEKTSFSNYGNEIRYSAPGSGIVAPYYDSYDSINGTSFSAPIITGMIAVMLSTGRYTGLGSARIDELLRALDKSCSYVGEGSGKGVPSLARALGLDSNDATPAAPSASIKPGAYEQEELQVELTTENSASSHADIIFYSDDGKSVTFTNGTPSANAKKYDPSEKITVTGKRTTVIKAIAVNPATGIVSDQVSFAYTLKPLVSDIEITTETGSYALQTGKDLTLISKCLPAYAADTGVTYAVTGYPDGAADGTGVYVKGSKVYASASAKTGKYTVTCTANDRGHFFKSFDVVVTSNNRKVYSIKASQTSLTVYAGLSEDVDIELTTTEGGVRYTESVADHSTWTSTSESVATAEINGNTLTIRGRKAGSTTIKGVSNDGTKVTRSITVKVLQHPESVKIAGVTGDRVAAGKSVKLSASVFPANASNRSVAWSIVDSPDPADKALATINSRTGAFSAKKTASGVYTVRATAKDKDNLGNDVYDDYRIEVSQSATTGIRFSKKSTDIYRVKNAYGSSVSDSIEVFASGGSPESISIENSDPGLVSAKLSKRDGSLYLDVEATANSAGICRIKAVSNDGTGKTATCTVNVLNPPSYLELSNPLECSNLAKGKSVKLVPKFGTAYGKLSSKTRKVVWKSSDPESLSVDQNGIVTARSERGNAATITAKTTDGSMSCSLRLTSVASISSMDLYGPLTLMRRTSDGKTFWKVADDLQTGKTYYISLDNTTDKTGRYFSSINLSYCDVSVDKQGITARWSKVGAEHDKDSSGTTTYSSLSLYVNKPGVYYVTIRMRDKSSASKRIKLVVRQ